MNLSDNFYDGIEYWQQHMDSIYVVQQKASGEQIR